MSRAGHLGARGRLGGGRLQGYGVHDLDLLLELVQDVEAVAAATEVGVSERPLGSGGMGRVTTSSNAASEGMLRSVWAAIREGAAPAPSLGGGLARAGDLRRPGYCRRWAVLGEM
jgi:predicted dehydrogenase